MDEQAISKTEKKIFLKAHSKKADSKKFAFQILRIKEYLSKRIGMPCTEIQLGTIDDDFICERMRVGFRFETEDVIAG
jgi:hypothetical protein